MSENGDTGGGNAGAGDDTADKVGDDASEERSLFGEKREATTLFLGSDLGITRVSLAAAQVGEFSLVERCSVQDMAATGGLVVVGTNESVLVSTGSAFEPLGFGPAVAVGIDDSWLYAAAADGHISRLDRTTLGGLQEWETVGTVSGPTQFDGSLLASEDGVFRVDDGLESLGLADVRAVSAGPYAGTPTGLYARRDGEWVVEYEGETTAIVAAADSAYAIVDGALLERIDGQWHERDVPGNHTPRLLAYRETLAVLSDGGTLSVLADPATSKDGRGGWRSQTLGVREPTGLAALD